MLEVAIVASIGSLLLVSVIMVSCVGCLKSLPIGSKKALEAKKADVESQPNKSTEAKMASSNSQENTSELYSAITDSQLCTKATVMVNSNVKEESPYDLPGDIEALFGDRANLYTKIERKRREHDDIKMIDADTDSTYNGRPEVPSKNFDYVKASRTFGEEEAIYYGAKSTAGSNHYELGSNLSSSHYDVLPEYETISQMVLMQQKQASGRNVVDEEEEDVYYSNLNQNETIANGRASEAPDAAPTQHTINITIHKL